MIVTLKVLHFLALAIGIGGGVANALIGANMAGADPAARPVLAKIQGAIGKFSAGSLVVLWITGVALVYLIYNGWGGLPASFWLKITFVVILTGLSVRLNMLAAKARRGDGPPPAKTMALLGQMATVCSVLIVIFAALAFTG